MRTLTDQDLWDAIRGAAVLATGGGGIAPDKETFQRELDKLREGGFKVRLVDLEEVPSDSVVFMKVGIGGGIELDIKRKYMRGSIECIRKQILEMDKVYPLPKWAEIPDEKWEMKGEERLIEILGKEPEAYLSFEVGPGVLFRQACEAARRNKPVIDADIAGYRAVPELSLSTLNIKHAPAMPAVCATPWGDLLIFEKVLSWQRFEDICRHLAIVSGGYTPVVIPVEVRFLREAYVPKTISKSIEVGRAIREALERGEDAVDAAVKACSGYKLFEGRVKAYLREDKGGFVWGETRFEGTGEFKNHTFKIWYKNENQISWLNGEPYVTCPDLICVVDAKTSWGLSNFRIEDWASGREVAIIGVKAADLWRTERGLRIYNPRHFGFEIRYKPIEEFFQ